MSLKIEHPGQHDHMRASSGGDAALIPARGKRIRQGFTDATIVATQQKIHAFSSAIGEIQARISKDRSERPRIEGSEQHDALALFIHGWHGRCRCRTWLSRWFLPLVPLARAGQHSQTEGDDGNQAKDVNHGRGC